MEVYKETELYIPQGLKQKREYYEGFGKKELTITIIGTLIGGIIDAVYYMISHNLMVTMFIIIAIPATIIISVIKDNNISVIDQISFLSYFSKSQKQYDYVSKDEWRL